MANALNMQGISFAIRGILPKAINCYSQSLKIFEELGNKGGVATAILNMGNIYTQQDHNEKALEYYVVMPKPLGLVIFRVLEYVEIP